MIVEPLVRDAEMPAGVAAASATIRKVLPEAYETTTLWLTIDEPHQRRRYRFEPGQFNMLGVFGVGEVPISLSSDPDRPLSLAHTVRSCGRVTDVIGSLKVGDHVTLRGPFGRPWPLANARGGDLVVVAGGLGFAPVRPAILRAIRHRASFRRIVLIVGARGPEHMLFRRELETWMHVLRDRGVEVHMTVDIADEGWPYREGVVTTLFPRAHIDPLASTVFSCGPEIMMWFAMRDLLAMGVSADRLWVSMERNMHCGTKLCGHCQLGPTFVCADGPVYRWDQLGPLLEVDEL